MTIQISAIELNPELVNIAYEMGLNVSKTCEIALKEAIRRLRGLNLGFAGVRNAVVNQSRFIMACLFHRNERTCSKLIHQSPLLPTLDELGDSVIISFGTLS